MKPIFILIFLILTMTIFAQEPKITVNKPLQDLIENIVSSSEKALDYSTLYDNLLYYSQHPLNLNAASQEDLEKFQFLNDIQIYQIQKYVMEYGPMFTIYELQAVEGLTKGDIENLLPFVTVGKVEKEQYIDWKNVMKHGNQQIIASTYFVVEQQKGFSPASDSLLQANPNARYLGSKENIFAKYKFTYRNQIEAGILATKDAGEEFFKGTEKQGFDFYSAHLQISNLNWLKTLVVGDYLVQFGQGLIMGNGGIGGKGIDPVNIRMKAQGLKYYSSSDENQFFRGIGATVKFDNIYTTAFFSHHKIDATNFNTDSLTNQSQITSFDVTGLHATPLEIAGKDVVTETVYGCNVSYHALNYRIGATFAGTYFSTDVQKSGAPYVFYDFKGDHVQNAGFDYFTTYNGIFFFGEFAKSSFGGLAMINGAIFKPASTISLAILHRYYEPNYVALYSNAMGENSSNQNENGIYVGADIVPFKNWKLSAYFDTYRFTWLKYQTDAPSDGCDYFVQAEYTPSLHFKLKLLYRNKIKLENTQNISSINYLDTVQRQSFRCQINYLVVPGINCSNRLEWCGYRKGATANENGMLLYHDVNYNLSRFHFDISARIAYFETASYNSAIWTFEDDALYGYSVPALYDKGVRAYLNLHYIVNKYIDCWVRWSQTYYTNLTTISTGLNQINGNTRDELKFQIRIKF